MKTLNLTFEDKEFKKLSLIKDRVNRNRTMRQEKFLNWEKIFMLMAEEFSDE